MTYLNENLSTKQLVQAANKNTEFDTFMKT